MINPELYNRTVGILVDAYFNDTLVHMNCAACAVGNIVAANMGYSFGKTKDDRIDWVENPAYRNGRGENILFPIITGAQLTARQKDELAATGYCLFDLIKIENAFERAGFGYSKDEFMFNGLMAVIDVLDEIHQNADTETTQQSKNKFHKQLKPSLQ